MNFLAVIALAILSTVARPTIAQTCNEGIVASAPDSRYSVNGDGTVTDQKTLLMWKRCPEGLSTIVKACDTGVISQLNWRNTLQQAQTANSENFAGHNNWRVPNIKELASLIEYRCYLPSINITVFPVMDEYPFFASSTPHIPFNGYGLEVFSINFEHGNVSSRRKDLTSFVRLVRTVQ